MNLKKSFEGWEPGLFKLIILLFLLQVAITLLSDGFVLSFDEAMWHYIGRNWFRHGLVPYHGGVDNKSPLIFAIFGISDHFFGVNYWFPRLIGTICQSVGVFYVYKIAKHVADHKTGMLAVSLYGLSLLWHGTGGKYVSYTETYEITFIIIAFYRFITAQNKADYFISGLLAAVGFGFRLSALMGIIALLVASLHKKRSDSFLFCAGILAVFLILTVIAIAAGINADQLFTYMFADNFGQGSATDHGFVWKVHNFTDKFLYSGLVLFYPLSIAYLFIKRTPDLFVVWLFLTFIGINIVGIYDTVHMKELLPAFSLVSAFAVNHLIKYFNLSFKISMVFLWVVFFPKSIEPLYNLKEILSADVPKPVAKSMPPYTIPDEGTRKKIGWWIRSNTMERDKVYIAGYGAQIQAYSERLSPSIYFNVTQTRIAKAQLFRDLDNNEPEMILVPLFPDYKQTVDKDLRVFIDDLAAKDYYLDSCIYSYNIFRIKK